MGALDPKAKACADFWREAGPDAWFRKDAAFDSDFRNRFLELHYAAARRELDHWMADAEGALALMILLDQFPRNAFRGTAHMFATDPLARVLAEQAFAAGHLDRTEPALRIFLLLPFEHSEKLDDQRLAVERIALLGDAEQAKYADIHLRIIERFGRFPHRNPALGRETTPAEQAFLDGDGFAG